ncbi:MAG: glycosyltransferase family 39 protein [Pseudomonadales bacterium]|jgi:4-amino-4-deoxy-L-arabinose transferase-like glycosyltransferase|nr:glycosyltransferase family 39 protein [Pseudomonadales bacterium]
MWQSIKKNYFQIVLFIIGIIFILTRFYQLTYLPVFADEAIYIRWSQLIINNPQDYLFFPMNDGKTPLHMWLMIPFLQIFSDPLWAGRTLSIVVGIIQIPIIMLLVKELGGKKNSQLLAAFLVLILPGWFFYQRLALIDGLMTLFLSINFLFTLKSLRVVSKKLGSKLDFTKLKFVLNRYTLLAGLFFGLAFWTKFAALLFAPVLIVCALFVLKKIEFSKKNFIAVVNALMAITIIGFIGGGIFALLRFSPIFPQIFSRGGDFLWSLDEYFANQIHIIVWDNFLDFIRFLAQNFDWLLMAFTIIASIFMVKKNHKPALLLLLALVFLLPMMVLGKVVWPRYLHPAMIFLTVGAVIAMQDLWEKKKKLCQSLIVGILVFTTIQSAYFMFTSYHHLGKMPLVAEDKVQYLEGWASGFGIPEATIYIRQQSQTHKILVLTEGFFGTLPDGILMYFFNEDVTNISIEGIGQPVREIPESQLERFDDFEEVILLVNSYRMHMSLPTDQLIFEVFRPSPTENPISFQVWRLK